MSKFTCIKIATAGCLAAITFAGAAVAQDEKTPKDAKTSNHAVQVQIKPAAEINIPEVVGYNVVSQVEDVRETVGDLIKALQNAGSRYGYADWKSEELNLKHLEGRVNGLESWIDRKQRMAGGSTWATYIASPIYGTWIHESVRDLGEILTKIADGMNGTEKSGVKLSLAVADDVVEQVDDIRETVEDLVQALDQAGRNFTHFNWAGNKNLLGQYEQKLSDMAETLERKEALADEEWQTWLGGNVYKVTVNKSIGELGEMMTGLGNALAGQTPTKTDDAATTH